MREKRSLQLAYSELQDRMLDEESRLAKAAKIAAVVQHFLGRSSLEGLRLLDIGCSAGIVAHDLTRRGAAAIGIDVDVPGLAKAQASFGKEVAFLCADAERLPLASGEIEVVVFNQIYEHVVDPVPVAAEIRRVLAPGGVAYLGLANRLGVIEPHYKLPFLSWLPRPLAHRYIRATGKADRYHERFLTRPGLRRLFGDLDVWDYTFPVLAEPDRFEARDVVPPLVHRLPGRAMRAVAPLIPQYIWIATRTPQRPLGGAVAVPPLHLGTLRAG